MDKLKFIERDPKSWCVHTLGDDHIGELIYNGGRDYAVRLSPTGKPDVERNFESMNVDEAQAYVEKLAIELGIIDDNTGKPGFLSNDDIGAFAQTQISNVYLLARTAQAGPTFFEHAAKELGACVAHMVDGDARKGRTVLNLFNDKMLEAFEGALARIKERRAESKNSPIAQIMEVIKSQMASGATSGGAAARVNEQTKDVEVVGISGAELREMLASGHAIEDDDNEDPKPAKGKTKATDKPVRH